MTEDLHTERLAPGIDDNDVLRAQRLKDEGLKVLEIAETLGVSVRQTYRFLVEAREGMRAGDMQTWTLSSSIEDGEPPEMAAYLLETNETVAWRRGKARYAWALHRVKPELPPELVSGFAEMHLNVSRRSGQDHEVWARILDLALVTEPWTGRENEDRFFEDLHARDEGDLEFAAQVFNYLKGISRDWQGVFRVEGPVPDQAAWLRRRIEAIKQEEIADQRKVRLIRTPGHGQREEPIE